VAIALKGAALAEVAAPAGATKRAGEVRKRLPSLLGSLWAKNVDNMSDVEGLGWLQGLDLVIEGS